ncbi:hypothetical protein BB560_005356 [Smittium megazygosporum]|uniref:AMP-dependent synthetase/ligase domain-containing protein n=2 Tax=Smittium megazygosporum TaxID=133381 RepID=A0A2T9Z6N5_9FUNG|nr:hypothetical protein BB560_005356 [Smittium megazygosporum]
MTNILDTSMSKSNENSIKQEFLPLWKPTDPTKRQAYKFIQYVNNKHGLQIDNYFDLHSWSCDKIADFWEDVWEFAGIISHAPYTKVYDESKSMDQVPLWFDGTLINFAENLLEKWKNCDRIAVYSRGEQEHLNITFRELYAKVAKIASAFRSMGLKKGDRVAAYTSNCLQALVGMLATSSIGAIWSSSAVDFGVTAVTDRFSQIEPKFFISVDESKYNGKSFSHIDKIKEIVKCLPTLEKIIVVQNNKNSGEISESIPGSISWNSLLDMGKNATSLEYELMSFNDPLYIMFSSGTTGKPKCLGILLQHIKEHKIILDINETDVFFYYTTTGWMMWNYLVTGLAIGASIVLYEGSPLGPSPSVLWDLVDEINITVFGTSAKYIQYLEDISYIPKKNHSLKSIKTILSTASPLKPNSYDFSYKNIKSDVLLGSISGGTDICSVFVGSCHLLPVYRGEITCPLLGMAVECWDSNGNSVIGQSGDLVCVKPFPCMPVYFWGDSNGERYKSSYFEKFPGVWCQGDFIKINPVTRGIIMLGRSDGTLNPNGVRFGSAEIYNIVENFDKVEDSLVVGQLVDQNERVFLFLKMKPGTESDLESVKQSIVKKIRANLSTRHVPAKILPVKKIPYTTNGKKIEIAVKNLITDCYNLGEQYRAEHKGADIEQVFEYVKKNIMIDKSKVVAVADFDSIADFAKIKDILF